MTTSSQKDIINDILSAMQCYPENEAFIIDDKHYTYAQLGEITASITHSLSEIKDEKIGIVAENRIETYAAILAVLAGGKTYVILHPAYPEERNLKIAALAGLRTLLCTSDTDRSAFGTGHFRIIDTDRLPGKNTVRTAVPFIGRRKERLYHFYIGKHRRAQRSAHHTG